MECDVCYGTPGYYPIINRHGTELYSIRCPECFGSGKVAEERKMRELNNRVGDAESLRILGKQHQDERQRSFEVRLREVVAAYAEDDLTHERVVAGLRNVLATEVAIAKPEAQPPCLRSAPDEVGCWYDRCVIPHCDCEERTAAREST